ncbi:MAG TPA: hemerythrin domain-containing protein [Polyangiales bacterium]|nr:hemerythrin domain-containing protein [Polyangiales bacterium]
MEEHAHLETIFNDLIAAANADARTESALLWTEFDSKLRAHMELEEQLILPAFAREHATEAAAILAEHEQIRSQLVNLGVGVDLHLVRADVIERFIALLRGHAAREDALLYAWTQAHLPAPDVLERLLERLHRMPKARSDAAGERR